jgi:pantoate--beta-alanine ligase
MAGKMAHDKAKRKSDHKDRPSTRRVPGKAKKAPAKVKKAPTKVKKAPAKVKKAPAKVKKAPAKVKKARAKVKKAPARVKKTRRPAAIRLPKPKGPFKVIRKIADMKKFIREARSRGRRIALVPTMGFLHDGHVSLIHEARRQASLVVVSVFVNPMQFGPQEDLDRYPRDFSGDRRKIASAGASCMFCPDVAELYPEGFQTAVEVTDVSRDLCGASRPGHFRGVTTVVAKLSLLVQPDVALFGEKDYQQLIIIRRMVRDLGLDIQVVGMPTVREEDGLAMSSRNTYLSPAQRQQALAISRGLRKAKKLCESGERDAAELAAVVVDILREQRDLEIEYVAVCHPETLERVQEVEREAVLLVACRVGETRLIDNIRLTTRKK